MPKIHTALVDTITNTTRKIVNIWINMNMIGSGLLSSLRIIPEIVLMMDGMQQWWTGIDHCEHGDGRYGYGYGQGFGEMVAWYDYDHPLRWKSDRRKPTINYA